jgi:hypothetical protein
MHKKYQLMLDIHRGSMSLVATPAWSMLLNLMVSGNGSFTVFLISHYHFLLGDSGDALMT